MTCPAPPRSSRATRTAGTVLALLAGALVVCLPGAALAQDGLTAVEPTGEWLRFEEVRWRNETLEVHLRTGYERPLIMPEPVRIAVDASVPSALDVDVDTEVVVFAPRDHFDPLPFTVVGERTGRRYTLSVRADPFGSRVPLRVVDR